MAVLILHTNGTRAGTLSNCSYLICGNRSYEGLHYGYARDRLDELRRERDLLEDILGLARLERELR